ncbi:MAG TPA: class I SAM-dependent methyltransferase [Candidatus Sulfotelmatobacter sp.]|nr:class I SAM-dependent methyltransferase [Candidatus Sulfotelmatobacter sp.]
MTRPSSRRPKVYDRAYYDRWYRNPRTRIHRRGAVERKVALALSAAEYLLERRVETVLDVGCGEGPWQPVLARLRPRIRYVGVDSSEFAVRRWGRTRGLRLGTFGQLADLGFNETYDLIVCSDVLHYVPSAELRPGLDELGRLLGGIAWIEVFTSADRITGDFRDMKRRSPAFYSRLFREAGLVPCGLYAFVRDDVAGALTAFERGSAR